MPSSVLARLRCRVAGWTPSAQNQTSGREAAGRVRVPSNQGNSVLEDQRDHAFCLDLRTARTTIQLLIRSSGSRSSAPSESRGPTPRTQIAEANLSLHQIPQATRAPGGFGPLLRERPPNVGRGARKHRNEQSVAIENASSSPLSPPLRSRYPLGETVSVTFVTPPASRVSVAVLDQCPVQLGIAGCCWRNRSDHQ